MENAISTPLTRRYSYRCFPFRSGVDSHLRVNAGFVLILMLNWRYMHWSVGKPE